MSKFCTKCGSNNEANASFCTKCGAPMSAETNAPPKSNVMDILKSKTFLGIVGAMVLLVLVIIIVKIQPKKINVEDFIEISYSGYDGYASAKAYLNEDELYNSIMEAKGTKAKDLEDIDSLEALFSSKILSQYYDINKCVDTIDLEISPKDKLSNGDSITVSISYDNKIAKEQKIKFTGKKVSEEVKGLEVVTHINPYKDLTVSYSGISPNGYLDYSYDGDTSYLSKYSFYVDKTSELRNGDIITISLDFSDEDTLYKGYVFTEKEKQYVVEGLDEYVENYADLSSDFLDKLKTEAQDTIYAYTASSYNKEISLDDLSYIGYAFNSLKSGPDYYGNYNELYLIYSGMVSHSENDFTTSKVYFPIKFTDILKNGDTLYYNMKSNILGSSSIDNSWFYFTSGYINPLVCYIELVESNRDNYVIECGDGFEKYADHKSILAIDDISQNFRDELAKDAKNIIESYVAKDYSTSSHMKDLSLLGEYLLVAKNQGTDFINNNKYILVYSATISNDDNNFETTEIYFPVEYDGIVSLPNDEYMVSERKGMLGSTYIGNSWYYTNGYTDGAEMFKKTVTANRDLYDYQVSDGLKEFGN